MLDKLQSQALTAVCVLRFIWMGKDIAHLSIAIKEGSSYQVVKDGT
jgi:hypothetical protein